MNDLQYENAFAVYQTSFGRHQSIRKYDDVDYKTIKTSVTALSHYMQYQDPNILNDNYTINYSVLNEKPLTMQIRNFDETLVDNLCITKRSISNKIKLNLEIINLLDKGLEYHSKLTVGGNEIYRQIAYRSPCLYKGITTEGIPKSILDRNGIIIHDSSIDIGSYNSTSTSLFVSLGFTYEKSTPGNLFVIINIDDNIKAFDFANFLLKEVRDPEKYPHRSQYLYLEEQELLFKRNLKLSNIIYFGKIVKYINEDDKTAIRQHTVSLKDYELAIAADGCMYNNHHSICSINLLYEMGLLLLKDAIAKDIATYLDDDIGKYIGTNVYYCDLTYNDISITPERKRAAIVVKNVSVEKEVVVDDVESIPHKGSHVEGLSTELSTKKIYYDNKEKPILSDKDNFIEKIKAKIADYTAKIASYTAKITSDFDKVKTNLLSFFNIHPSFNGGKAKKINKKDIIININKLVSNIKGLNKLNKKELENLYNYLNELYKYKKYELINKYKLIDLNKSMTKSKMIYLIYLQSKYNKSI